MVKKIMTDSERTSPEEIDNLLCRMNGTVIDDKFVDKKISPYGDGN